MESLSLSRENGASVKHFPALIRFFMCDTKVDARFTPLFSINQNRSCLQAFIG
jgi:hypothetical protein